jgi:uncharacterized membrane protein (GlpM family)
MNKVLKLIVALVLLLITFGVVSHLIHAATRVITGLVTIALWAIIIYFAFKFFGGREDKLK